MGSLARVSPPESEMGRPGPQRRSVKAIRCPTSSQVVALSTTANGAMSGWALSCSWRWWPPSEVSNPCSARLVTRLGWPALRQKEA